jgi:hypothetical protein
VEILVLRHENAVLRRTKPQATPGLDRPGDPRRPRPAPSVDADEAWITALHRASPATPIGARASLRRLGLAVTVGQPADEGPAATASQGLHVADETRLADRDGEEDAAVYGRIVGSSQADHRSREASLVESLPDRFHIRWAGVIRLYAVGQSPPRAVGDLGRTRPYAPAGPAKRMFCLFLVCRQRVALGLGQFAPPG